MALPPSCQGVIYGIRLARGRQVAPTIRELKRFQLDNISYAAERISAAAVCLDLEFNVLIVATPVVL
jgi:hypothetical protein